MPQSFDQVITSPHFIGRAAQLAAVDQWLAQGSAGRRQVVCVAGEAGIGKSGLAVAVRRCGRSRGNRCR